MSCFVQTCDQVITGTYTRITAITVESLTVDWAKIIFFTKVHRNSWGSPVSNLILTSESKKTGQIAVVIHYCICPGFSDSDVK